ncbi:MAG: hypothetical protein Q8936_01400 [Bacillota bacterium]|nr:hypothetical protein [Bacillota bacterium]
MTIKQVYNTKDILDLTGMSRENIRKEFRNHDYYEAYKVKTWQQYDNWQIDLEDVLKYFMPLTPACKPIIWKELKDNKGAPLVEIDLVKHAEMLENIVEYRERLEKYIDEVLK